METSRSLDKDPEDKKICLRWTKLSDNCEPYVVKTAGEATLVGNRIYWSGITGDLSVLSFQNWRWLKLSSRLTGIGRGHMAQLVDDKIYLFGGFGQWAVIEYDIVLESVREVFTVGESFGGIQFMASVNAPWRKEIITFGGLLAGTVTSSNEIHTFKSDTKTWKKLEMRGSKPAPRSGACACLRGSKLYIYSGYGLNGFFRDLWIAELSNHCPPFWAQVQMKSNYPPPRIVSCMSQLAGLFVVFGGAGEPVNVRRDLRVFDINENLWLSQSIGEIEVKGGPPSQQELHIDVAVSNGIIYLTKSGIYMLSLD